MRILIVLGAAALGIASLHAQAAAEAGLGASRAATTTAPAAGLGKSAAGVFSSLEKTLNQGKTSSSTTTDLTPARNTAPPDKSAPAKPYEDIKKAETGLEYDELVDRFGPPSLEVAGATGEKKLTYAGKEGPTQIEVKDGKVASIKRPQKQSSVFTLPK
jgi:hypothetical protein